MMNMILMIFGDFYDGWAKLCQSCQSCQRKWRDVFLATPKNRRGHGGRRVSQRRNAENARHKNSLCCLFRLFGHDERDFYDFWDFDVS
jgi:hypothetical protein